MNRAERREAQRLERRVLGLRPAPGQRRPGFPLGTQTTTNLVGGLRYWGDMTDSERARVSWIADDRLDEVRELEKADPVMVTRPGCGRPEHRAVIAETMRVQAAGYYLPEGPWLMACGCTLYLIS